MASTNEGWTTRLRRSPMYRVASILPTPVRPWLLAFETIAGIRMALMERKHGRREASLEKQLTRALSRRGGGLKGMIIGAGLSWAAKKLLASKPAAEQKVRISGFVNDALDRVQAVAEDRFSRVRGTVAAKKDQDQA